jgi:hypothetical protein
MSRLVCYIPSYNDSPWVAESVATSPDWEIVISDNASEAPHAGALQAMASPRVQVVRQEESLGRVGNWKFCIEHFIRSGAEWMKFMMAGDLHKPGSCDMFRRAIDRCPDARTIVPRIENVWPNRRIVFRPTPGETVMSPAQAMATIVELGNIFHGLSGPLLHVDAVKDGFAFGEDVLSYCADLLFMLRIARKLPTLFITDVTAEFIAERRKGMQAGIYTLEHYLEEGLVRLRAADAYLQLTGDRAGRTRLLSHIVAGQRHSITHSLEKLAGDVRYATEVLTGEKTLAEMPPIRNF